MVLSIKKVGVVGAGVMGSEIADVMALNGIEVIMTDVAQEFIDKGMQNVERLLTSFVRYHVTRADREIRRIESEDGIRLSEEQRMVIKEKFKPTFDEKTKADILSRIRTTLKLDDFKDTDIVIEAIIEDIGTKSKLLRDLDGICDQKTILASNTSTISITELASATKRPDRVIGLHFFNPPSAMPLIEVIPGVETAPGLVEDLLTFLSGLKNHRHGLVPIKVKEVPGFLVNRVLYAMLHEAFALYEEGVASMKDIDLAMKSGAAWPMGPFELADHMGVDVLYHVARSINTQQGGNTMPKPVHVVRQLYFARRFGRKTGRGFYEYE